MSIQKVVNKLTPNAFHFTLFRICIFQTTMCIFAALPCFLMHFLKPSRADTQFKCGELYLWMASQKRV